METYRVRAIRVGEADVPSAECFLLERVTELEPLAYYVLAVESANRTILVNSGPPRDLSGLNADWIALGERAFGPGPEARRMQLRVRPEEQMPRALIDAGIDPDAVDDVIVTPIAAYATGNLHVFPRARIWLSRRGWLHFLAPPRDIPAYPRANVIPDDVLVALVTTAADRVRLLDDEDVVAPGVETFWTGGHHRGSIAVRVHTAAGTLIYADCAFVRANLDRNVPIGGGQSVLECYRAYARIRREADVIVPGYDPAVLDGGPTLA